MSYRFAARRPFPRRIVWSIWWFCVFVAVTPAAQGYLQPQDLLLVVNDDSPTSKYVANLYRQYYPSITDNQIVHLSGLPDAAVSTTNEIINRSTFDTNIASPIRQHLVNNGLVNSTKAIVTTAGLPYRISDPTYTSLVRPGGSTPYPASSVGYVQAASVESELAVLFQVDSASPTPMPKENRLVNPYQGYRYSPIDAFPRDILNNRANMTWMTPLPSGSTVPPLAEGDFNGYGMQNRHFSAGDIYLTCRLDGPKTNGLDGVFAVRDMLERSQRASSAGYGINPSQAAAVLDDIGGTGSLDTNKLYNVQKNTVYNQYVAGQPLAPNITNPSQRDDFSNTYSRSTGNTVIPGALNVGTMPNGHNLTMVYDQQAAHRTNQSELATGKAAVAVVSYGVNGDEAVKPSDYILHGGPGGTSLFQLTYGAVFDSVESYNAVTLFNNVSTGQGKIVDFITIGGTGAIGHAFEPLSDAIVDNEFLFYNLLADMNNDGFADMTFAEAAFTALPWLSWSEVVIGDPLMRIAYGNGGLASQGWLLGDVNFDGMVNASDMSLAGAAVGSLFGDSRYNDGADLDRDGLVSSYDLWLISEHFGEVESIGNQPIPEPVTGILFVFSALLSRCYTRSNKIVR